MAVRCLCDDRNEFAYLSYRTEVSTHRRRPLRLRHRKFIRWVMFGGMRRCRSRWVAAGSNDEMVQELRGPGAARVNHGRLAENITPGEIAAR